MNPSLTSMTVDMRDLKGWFARIRGSLSIVDIVLVMANFRKILDCYMSVN